MKKMIILFLLIGAAAGVLRNYYGLATKESPLSTYLSSSKTNYSFLYFGYTFCPDFCPTTLARLRPILEEYSIDLVFISLDPKRDTTTHLRNYLLHFHSRMWAPELTEGARNNILKHYQVSYQINSPAADKDYYTVDHTTDFFLIDKKGQILATFAHDDDIQKIKKTLNSILQKPLIKQETL